MKTFVTRLVYGIPVVHIYIYMYSWLGNNFIFVSQLLKDGIDLFFELTNLIANVPSPAGVKSSVL